MIAVPDEMPRITFTSAAGARNCGLSTDVAATRGMDDYVQASGIVDYDQTRIAQLSTRVPGSVSHVLKHLGDHVERGDALVIIDSADVGEAKAKLLEASVMYRLKREHLERLSSIKNAIAGREYLEIEAACEMARAQRFNAMQKLINLGFSITAAEIETLSADQLAAFLHGLGLPESLQHQSASGNLIPLLAPFSGVITTCSVVQGEIVQPSSPVYVVADTGRMWLQLSIRQGDAAKVKLESEVQFKSDLQARPVIGTLTWIGTEIDPKTRTLQARAEVENPSFSEGDTSRDRRILQASAYGTAQILVKTQPAVLAVPNSALHWQWEIGRDVVFIAQADGKTFVPHVVSRGLVRDDHVQILDGLTAGTRVVTEGSRILSAELSEHLQKHLGDNADAVRDFDHSHGAAAHSTAASTH